MLYAGFFCKIRSMCNRLESFILIILLLLVLKIKSILIFLSFYLDCYTIDEGNIYSQNRNTQITDDYHRSPLTHVSTR